MRNVHESRKQTNKVNCNLCGKSVAESHLKGHLKIHEAKQKQSQIETCPICKKKYSFQDGKDLSMHIAKHKLPKNFQCEHCKKMFVSNSVLTAHIRLHTGEKPFSCSLCSMDFYDLSGKKQHEKRHSESLAIQKEPRYIVEQGVCKVCGKLVKNLGRHNKIHTTGGVSKCEACQRTFTRVDTMKRHISMVHENSKPFSCDICQKSFSLNFQLADHKESHQELEMKCDHCENRFPTKKRLKQHIQSKHKPKVPVVRTTCIICKKTLFDTATLNRHNRLIHSKERPFPCKSCPLSFALRSMLNTHKKDRHGEKVKM